MPNRNTASQNKIPVQNNVNNSDNNIIEANANGGSRMATSAKIELNGIELDALIDTGAKTTMVSAKCAEQCGLEILPLLDGRNWGAANNSPMAVKGKANANFRIGSDTFKHEVIIADPLANSIMIGTDIIKDRKCIINFEKEEIRINDSDIPMIVEETKNTNAHCVFQICATQQIYINPNSDYTIYVKFPEKAQNKMIIENRNNKGLQVKEALIGVTSPHSQSPSEIEATTNNLLENTK